MGNCNCYVPQVTQGNPEDYNLQRISAKKQSFDQQDIIKQKKGSFISQLDTNSSEIMHTTGNFSKKSFMLETTDSSMKSSVPANSSKFRYSIKKTMTPVSKLNKSINNSTIKKSSYTIQKKKQNPNINNNNNVDDIKNEKKDIKQRSNNNNILPYEIYNSEISQSTSQFLKSFASEGYYFISQQQMEQINEEITSRVQQQYHLTVDYIQARNQFKKEHNYNELPPPILHNDVGQSLIMQKRDVLKKKIQELQLQNRSYA